MMTHGYRICVTRQAFDQFILPQVHRWLRFENHPLLIIPLIHRLLITVNFDDEVHCVFSESAGSQAVVVGLCSWIRGLIGGYKLEATDEVLHSR